MLNAFRHHRNSHYDHRDRFGSTEECSTPFGIIGILTGDLTGTYPNPSVCSTPFGIIGILTALVPTTLFAARYKSVFAHLFVLR